MRDYQQKALDEHVDPTKKEKTIYKKFMVKYKPLIAKRVYDIAERFDDHYSDSYNDKIIDLIANYHLTDDEALNELNKEMTFVWMFRAIVWTYLKKKGMTDLDFIDCCHDLSHLRLFQAEGDYTEEFIDCLPQEYFDELETLPLTNEYHIGFMYQFFCVDMHDNFYGREASPTFESHDDFLGATVFYTPHWVVRGMVEGSLGKLWIDHLIANDEPPSIDELREKYKDSEKPAWEYVLEEVKDKIVIEDLKKEQTPHNKGTQKDIDEYEWAYYLLKLSREQEVMDKYEWAYYLPEAEQKESAVNQQRENRKESFKDLKPQEITFMDPCVGCGNILFYAFDVFRQIYDDPKSIVENNLYSSDVDPKSNRLFETLLLIHAGLLHENVHVNTVCPLIDGDRVNRRQIMWFGEDLEGEDRIKALAYIKQLLDNTALAKFVGALITPSCKYPFDLMRKYVNSPNMMFYDELESIQLQLNRFIDFMELMSMKFHCVVTNPPYLGSRHYSPEVSEWLDGLKFMHLPDTIDYWEDIVRPSIVSGFNGIVGSGPESTEEEKESTEKEYKEIIGQLSLF